MSKSEHITNAVKEALKADPSLYGRGDILPKSAITAEECGPLNNVLKYIAPGCAAGDILLIIDTSNGKGKRGFVFTENALYISKDMVNTGAFSKPVPMPLRYEDYIKIDKEQKYKADGDTMTIIGSDGRRYIISQGSYTEFMRVLRKRLNFAMMKAAKEEEADKKAKLAKSAHEIIARGEALEKAGDLAGMAKCFARAADTEDPESLYRYARLYEEGRGVKKDLKTAFKWYEKAYYKGSENACVKVAEMLADGRGADNDLLKSRSLYMSAALAGHQEGMYRYGLILLGEREYDDLALTYLKRAAESGHAGAMEVYARIADKRDREYDAAASLYLAEDYDKAARAFMELAEKGVPRAQYHCGYMYWSGLGFSRSEENAFIWFKKSADNGFVPAMVACSKLYRSGQGVERDESAARKMMRKAADLGSAEADIELKKGGFFDPHVIFRVR